MRISLNLKILFVFQIALFLNSCFYNIPNSPENIDWKDKELSLKTVIESKNHLGFPDLIYYDNKWYITYREADSHGISKEFSKIKVLTSSDFSNWSQCGIIDIDGFDLRDPKLSVDNTNNNLYLHFHAVSNGNYYELYRYNHYVLFNDSISAFRDDSIQTLQLPRGHTKEWLWRPIWRNGKLFVGGYDYDNSNLTFYKYDNINLPPLVFAKFQNGSESTLRFYNDDLYTIIRRKTSALFGKFNITGNDLARIEKDTTISLTQYDVNQLVELGGPNMIISDSVVYIGGRAFDDTWVQRTSIYKFSLRSKELTILVRLESYHDNSYPGMALNGNKIHGVYYTNSVNGDKFEIKTFILPL